MALVTRSVCRDDAHCATYARPCDSATLIYIGPDVAVPHAPRNNNHYHHYHHENNYHHYYRRRRRRCRCRLRRRYRCRRRRRRRSRRESFSLKSFVWAPYFISLFTTIRIRIFPLYLYLSLSFYVCRVCMYMYFFVLFALRVYTCLSNVVSVTVDNITTACR